MAVYYLETSALVKLYVREPGTERLLSLANTRGNQFSVFALSQVEFHSAIRRRQRAGDIEQKIADLILDRFRIHMETRFLRQAVTESVLDSASEIVDRYALRAYDAVQLAACLALKITFPGETPTFVCSDQELLQAAIAEQLSAFDPSQP